MQRSFIRLFEQIQTNCYNNVKSLETSMAFLHLEKWYTLCNKKYVTKYPYVWSTVCLGTSSPIEWYYPILTQEGGTISTIQAGDYKYCTVLCK